MSEAGVTPSESTLIPGFILHLDNFDGPFDLLLQLISRHKMDVTEVALSVVTDEFIAHIRSMDGGWKLETATEFWWSGQRCWTLKRLDYCLLVRLKMKKI